MRSPPWSNGCNVCVDQHGALASRTRPIARARKRVRHDDIGEDPVARKVQHRGFQLRERSVAVFSFGKTPHSTGLRVGYAVAPPALTAEFRKVHQFNVFTVNTPMQHALATYMADPQPHLELAAFYQRKRDRFIELTRASRFRPLPCHGTYYQMLSYAGISDEPETEFARRLTVDHGVAAIPPSVFYHERDDHKVLRFCFAKKEETLVAAAARLCAI